MPKKTKQLITEIDLPLGIREAITIFQIKVKVKPKLKFKEGII